MRVRFRRGWSLQRLGFTVGLLDADIYGPSQQMMLGIEARPRMDETDEKILPMENHARSSPYTGTRDRSRVARDGYHTSHSGDRSRRVHDRQRAIFVARRPPSPTRSRSRLQR